MTELYENMAFDDSHNHTSSGVRPARSRSVTSQLSRRGAPGISFRLLPKKLPREKHKITLNPPTTEVESSQTTRIHLSCIQCEQFK